MIMSGIKYYDCDFIYIGQTSWNFSLRFKEYKNVVKNMARHIVCILT